MEDNTRLFNYAFSSFADYHAGRGAVAPDARDHAWTVAVAGGRKGGAGAVRLVPALDETFTVPVMDQDSPTAAASSIRVTAEIPDMILGGVRCGDRYGTIHYWLGDTELWSLPLVADRDVEAGNGFALLSAKILMHVMAKAKEFMQ